MFLKLIFKVSSLVLICHLSMNFISVWQPYCRLAGTADDAGGQEAGGQRSFGG